MDTPVVTREDDGRWQKGVSGNPAGRPKGSRNRIVELQHQLEIVIREHLSVARVKNIIEKLAAEAENGNVKAAKLLLDKIIPNATTGEESSENGRTVVFQIRNATFAAQHEIAPRKSATVDGEFTVVESDTSHISTLQDQDGHQATE